MRDPCLTQRSADSNYSAPTTPCLGIEQILTGDETKSAMHQHGIMVSQPQCPHTRRPAVTTQEIRSTPNMPYELDTPIRYPESIRDLTSSVQSQVLADVESEINGIPNFAEAEKVLTAGVANLVTAWLQAADPSSAHTLGESLTTHWLALDAVRFRRSSNEHLQTVKGPPGHNATFTNAWEVVTRIDKIAFTTGDWTWARRNLEQYVIATTHQR